MQPFGAKGIVPRAVHWGCLKGPTSQDTVLMTEYKIVDLFAGTGGMGLAALRSSALRDRGRIVWTAEINPVYTSSIERNYKYFAERIGDKSQVPDTVAPADLSRRNALATAREVASRHDGIDILLAGPPCQGFSLANRRSRVADNPLNALSLKVVTFVRALSPSIVILENVPGIRTLRAEEEASRTTIQVLEERLRKLKYDTHVMLLDAADYGVPQHRLRSFLVAVKRKTMEDLSVLVPRASHGPGRAAPYVSVHDAFSDLPSVDNGAVDLTTRYGLGPQNAFQRKMRRGSMRALADHITSRHSDYVLRRFAKIPPGGNWTSIAKMMTNYSDAARTHLNIYHRLDPTEPAKTIGNFRKAMLVHPSETRGLSLREAARLQSIPDWYRFAEPNVPVTRSVVPHLNAYQQQIGNAVSFLLTEKLVSHVVNKVQI